VTPRRWLYLAPVLASLAMLNSACAQKPPEFVSAPSDSRTVQGDPMTTPGRFDALAVSVVLPSTRVSSGKTLHSRLIVENPSRTTVVDPACHIAEGRYALVPVTDPDAELWVRPLTDCGGPYRMQPGFRDEWLGPAFPAHTKFGDPLAPGEYLAVLEIQGLSQSLRYPVTVQ
jgi:hypothetical protein